MVATLDISLGIKLSFKSATGATSRYGKLGNLDRIVVAHGRTKGGVEDPLNQGFQWTEGNGASVQFAGGDNDTKYHISTRLHAPLSTSSAARSDERLPQDLHGLRAAFRVDRAELEDGCFLTAGVGAAATVWPVDDASKLSGGRYFIGDADHRGACAACRRGDPGHVQRGYEASTPGPGRLAPA